jgi:hypothetical protein
MRNTSPCYIQKAPDTVAGKVTCASRLKDLKLLVEAINDKQAEVLLKETLLGSHPVQVETHTSLNSCRGAIHTDSLDGMSEEEIQLALADHFVSRA